MPPATQGPAFALLGSMRGWKGDGIIAATNNQSELRYIRKTGIPAVNLAGAWPDSCGVPRVLGDNFQAGRLAADHLLSRGLRHLAFYGWKDLLYSEQRSLAFRERAAEAGIECDTFLPAPQQESGQSWPQRVAIAAKWLATLPRPTGIYALHDYRAQFLMEACHEAGLRIPEHVAIMGMDNDKTICEHAIPTLTSISRNSELVGWKAAALLDRLMHGEPPPNSDVLVEPDGVIVRQSTDMLYCGDPMVQRALNYMRANLRRPFNIEHLAEHVGVSKRTLETRFRARLESSPHDFVTRLRVQQAQLLMKMPQKRTLEQTAAECGFGTVRALNKVFHRVVGESPSSYRKRLLAKKAVPFPPA